MNEAMSVSLIANTHEYGGAERYLYMLARGLGECVRAVYLPGGPDSPAIRPVPDHIGVKNLPTNGFAVKPADIIRSLRFYRKVQTDILHFNLCHPCASTADIIAARMAGRSKIIVTTHLPTIAHTAKETIMDRVSLRYAHHIITVCESARAFLIGRGLPESKITTVYNGVEEHITCPEVVARLREELSINSNDIVLGTVARLENQKGLAYLLRALRLLRQRTSARIVWCLVGDGSQSNELKDMAADLGISDSVRFCGWRSDSRDLMSVFDVFVLPSLFESFPFTIVEAMMAGKPVVATDVGGVREAVDDGRTGVLVSPRDPEALYAALADLIGSRERMTVLGNAGYKRAMSSFSLDKMMSSTLSLYRSILQPGT
ncbi:MAG: glycosyltransferase family 4 protein [Armatimonadota bacterium]